MVNRYKINTLDIYTAYGWVVAEKFYEELLRMPARRYVLTKIWADQHGTSRYLGVLEYDDRQLNLKFNISATSENELYQKYNAAKSLIEINLQFDFVAVEMNRLFKLKYLSMPSFEKLTVFRDNNKIMVEFAISVVDEYPEKFWDAAGADIALVFPPDKPDEDIDLSEYGFELIDGYMYVTGDGVSIDSLKINGNIISEAYGLYPGEGFYEQLMKMADAKTEMPLKFHTRTLDLPFILRASSEVDFYYKYYALVGFFIQSKYFNLDINGMARRFKLCYSAMATVEPTQIRGANKILALLKITVFDDFPTQNDNAQIYDLRFTIEGDNLFYEQSTEFDDQVSFEVVEGNLIITKNG